MSEPQPLRTGETNQRIHATLSGLDEMLIEALNDELSRDELREYAQAVTRVSELAGDSGLTGLHDVGRLYAQAIEAWLSDGSTLSRQAYESLLAWPALIRAYVDAPADGQASEALLDHLQGPGLDVLSGAEGTAILRAMLRTPAPAEGLPALEPSDRAADFWEQSGGMESESEALGLSVALVDALAGFCGADTSGETDATLARQYESNIDALACAAAEDGWMGLHDACQLLKEALSVMGDWDAPPSRAQQRIVARWPELLRTYIEAPGLAQPAEAIIEQLRDPELNLQLAEADAEILRCMLGMRPDAQQLDSSWGGYDVPGAPVDEPGVAVAGAITSSLDGCDDANGPTPQWLLDSPAPTDAAGKERFADALVQVMAEEANPVAPASRVLDVAGQPGVLDQCEADLARGMACSETDIAAADSGATGRGSFEDAAAPDITQAAKEGVTGAAALVAGSGDSDAGAARPICAALEAAICALDSGLSAAEAGDAAFLSHYAEHVIRIADAAADDEQMGLHDVCLLLQEDLLAALADAAPLERSKQVALCAWPGEISDFVKGPQTPETVDTLLAGLRCEGFLAALGDADIAILKSMFAADAGGELEETVGPSFDDIVLGSLPDNGESVDADDHLGVGESLACPEDGVAEEDFIVLDAPDPPATRAGGALQASADEQRQPEQRSSDRSESVCELLELLGSELEQIRADASAAFEGVESAQPSRAALESLALSVERFGGAGEAVGLAGLRVACECASQNLFAIAEAESAPAPGLGDTLQRTFEHLAEYVGNPDSTPAVTALVASLGESTWPRPLPDDEAQALGELLATPDFTALEEDVPQRAEQASSEDVSLALPEDVDAELLDGLLQELPAQTGEFSAAIQRLTDAGSFEDIDIAQRVAHTLKGAGNTVGVRGIAALTHQLEDILLALAKQRVLPNRALADCMLGAADCLAAMCEALLGVGSAPHNAKDVLQEVLDWANRIDREGVPEEQAPAAAPPEVSDPLATPEPPPTAPAAPAAPGSPAAAFPAGQQVDLSLEAPAAAAAQSIVPMLRIPAEFVDELLRLVGETIIQTGQVHEGLERGAAQNRAMRVQFDLLQRLGYELEQLIDIKNLHFSSPTQGANGEFDPLEMEQYGELHTVSRRLVEAATDARELGKVLDKQLESLDDMLVNQERLNRETQEAVLRTRMVQVKTVLPRLERSVRQTCRLTGKKAELSVRGSETLIDSDVLNEIVDPLMHVLRNAVDHGIEDAEQRRAQGKPPVGSIGLEFMREGSNVVVRCSDDGRGLDFEAIRHTATRRGILNRGQELPQADLARLVLRPNFSTRSATTQTSGRGIGLDAVYARVIELGGSISIDSTPGAGCKLELRLPVTLISTHALLVGVHGQAFAIADRGVEQILHPDSGELRKLGDQQVFHVSDAAYPVRRLSALLDQSGQHRSGAQAVHSVLLAQGEAGLTAVLVDEVLGSRDVVVKGLGQYIPKMHGILGATILGDGSVTPVLDLPELLRQPHAAPYDDEELDSQPPIERRILPAALVVDDSLSARRSLEQILHDGGYEVRTARDGMEAAGMLESDPPDVLVTDLEMPRMNGMELARHVRGREHVAALPVIMVTSRSTNKHREQAKSAGVDVYLTKPFSEDELLTQVERLRAGV